MGSLCSLRKTRKDIILAFFVVIAQLLSAGFVTPVEIPITSESGRDIAQRNYSYRSLSDFIGAIASGNPDQVVGVFVTGVMAQQVVRQPKSNPGYVSSQPNAVTQFSIASKYGSLGFLAHNYLSGVRFFELERNDIIFVIYGDGRTRRFRINEIRRFQALTPDSPYSDFLDLENGNALLSAEDLFFQTYGQSEHVIFQTCIENNGKQTWGRLFVMAEPAEWFKYPGRKVTGSLRIIH
jgi:hypothetical protein